MFAGAASKITRVWGIWLPLIFSYSGSAFLDILR